MANDNEPRQIENIISAQRRSDGLYMVLTSYRETDAMNAAGQILHAEWDPDGPYSSVLTTNDALANMWMSPAGHLWVGSSWGNVWTTAPVTWPAHSWKPLQYNVPAPHLDWKVTTLPPYRKLNYPPNVTAIWGVDDSNVFVGTFKGAIYHWNGNEWREQTTGVESALNHIHGLDRDSIFCVGEQGVILRYTGRAWQRLPLPKRVDEDLPLTGVRVVDKDEVFACARGGAILHGGARGFELLTSCRTSFYSIAHFEERLFLAGGDTGIWELKRNKASVIKDTFAAVGLFEAGERLIVIEPTQEPGPCVIEYEPSNPSPWWRRDL